MGKEKGRITPSTPCLHALQQGLGYSPPENSLSVGTPNPSSWCALIKTVLRGDGVWGGHGQLLAYPELLCEVIWTGI